MCYRCMGRTGHERSCATDRRLGVESWPDAMGVTFSDDTAGVVSTDTLTCQGIPVVGIN